MAEATPTPVPTELTKPFWDAAADGRLVLQRSGERYQWYPRAHAADDLLDASEPEWVEASGYGVVHSFSIVHRSPFADLELPYVIALVELEEGVLLTTRIVDVPLESVRIGDAVVVSFEHRADGFALPVFSPAAR